MDYQQWNNAIIQYFTVGLPAGVSVYLSIDEDVLEDIGQRSGETPSRGSWTDDFLEAVRSACLWEGQVSLNDCHGSTDGLPQCVAFLAAMVLAASHMAEEDSSQLVTAEHNYFTRLREVLGLPTRERGRPEGLRTGSEEVLWWNWKCFLVERNFVPSADRGDTTASRYVHYPLSQTLLRQGDIARLEDLFREERGTGRLGKYPDANTMGAWFRNYAFRWHHLAELASDKDERRFEATVAALLELYYAIDFSHAPRIDPSGRRTVPLQRLTAAFYRIEDSITGGVDYRLYPREPRRGVAGRMEIEHEGRWIGLRQERPGWFFPMWPEPLAGGSQYRLRGDARWKELVVPQAAFRLFVVDPNDPESTVFAEWQAPGIEEMFLFVCRERYIEQLVELRKQKLLEWTGEPVPLREANEGWFEFHKCMILAPNWTDVTGADAELREALRPRLRATVSFSGGLRAPSRDRRGWMVGYAPVLRVSAFQEYVRLRITDMAHPEAAVFDDTVATQSPLTELPELPAANYFVEAFIAGKTVATQSFDVVGWETLEPKASPTGMLGIPVGGYTVRGALIEKSCDGVAANGEGFHPNGQAIQQNTEASTPRSLFGTKEVADKKESVAEASLPDDAAPIRR